MPSPFGDPPARKVSPFGDPAVEDEATPSLASDLLQSAGAGLRRGGEALLGLPGDVNQMTQSLAHRLATALLGESGARQAAAIIPEGLKSEGVTTEDVRAVSDPMLGPAYEPKTRPGRYTRSIMEQAPTAVAGPGGRMAKIAQMLLAGVGTEAAGEAAEGTGYEGLARAGGGMAGALLPGGAIRMAPTSSRQAINDANVALLQREGVPLTAGQQRGSTAKKYIESELGGSRYEDFLDDQRSAYTSAGMRRAGEPGGTALPEDIARARDRIGGTMDQLAAGTTVPFDAPLQNALVDIGARYENLAPMQAPGVRQMFNSIIDKSALNGGMLTGEQYQEMSTVLRQMAESADPAMEGALNGFRNALDDAIERSLSGPSLDQWRQARREYANLMTISRAMKGQGVEAASGQIAPGPLRSAISGGGNDPSMIAEGRSTMTDLANAGVGVMKDMPPNSGTAGRLAARAIPATVGGAAAGAVTGEPFSAAALAAATGFIGPEIMGRAVMGPLGQSAMLGPSENQRLLLAALLAARQGAAGGP